MFRRRQLSVYLSLVAAACLGNSASAAVLTWSNSGTAWNAASNWGTATPGSGDVGLFNLNNAYTYQPVLTSAGTIGGVWDAGSGSVAISGSALTLNSATIGSNSNVGIEMDPGSGALTVSAPLTFGAAQQWLNNSSSGGVLTVSGAIANGGFLLTVGGSGNSLLSGAISARAAWR